jgi:hypothetical protein
MWVVVHCFLPAIGEQDASVFFCMQVRLRGGFVARYTPNLHA